MSGKVIEYDDIKEAKGTSIFLVQGKRYDRNVLGRSAGVGDNQIFSEE